MRRWGAAIAVAVSALLVAAGAPVAAETTGSHSAGYPSTLMTAVVDSADDNGQTMHAPLFPAATYLIVASGLFDYGFGPTVLADPECAQAPSDDRFLPNRYGTGNDDLADLFINGGVTWKPLFEPTRPCDPLHTYYVVGDTPPNSSEILRFFVRDPNHKDNVGSLSVQVFRCAEETDRCLDELRYRPDLFGLAGQVIDFATGVVDEGRDLAEAVVDYAEGEAGEAIDELIGLINDPVGPVQPIVDDASELADSLVTYLTNLASYLEGQVAALVAYLAQLIDSLPGQLGDEVQEVGDIAVGLVAQLIDIITNLPNGLPDPSAVIAGVVEDAEQLVAAIETLALQIVDYVVATVGDGGNEIVTLVQETADDAEAAIANVLAIVLGIIQGAPDDVDEAIEAAETLADAVIDMALDTVGSLPALVAALVDYAEDQVGNNEVVAYILEVYGYASGYANAVIDFLEDL